MNNKKLKKKIVPVLTILFVMFSYVSVFASGAGNLENTKLVTGTKSLLAAGTTVLTGLVLAITIFVGVKDGMAWQASDDQQKPAAKKKVVLDIAIGIVTMCIGGIITAVFAFYQ